LTALVYCCVVGVVPGEPRRIRADVVNSTAIRVQWRPPEINQDGEHTLTTSLSGVVRGYRVYVRVDGAEPSSPPAAPRDVANAEATEMIVTGLRPDTTYLVHATAYTRRADGQPSRTVKVRTKGAGMPNVILSFFLSNRHGAVASLQFTVRWVDVYFLVTLFPQRIMTDWMPQARIKTVFSPCWEIQHFKKNILCTA